MPGLPHYEVPLCDGSIQAPGKQPIAAVHRVFHPHYAAQARLLPPRHPLQNTMILSPRLLHQQHQYQPLPGQYCVLHWRACRSTGAANIWLTPTKTMHGDCPVVMLGDRRSSRPGSRSRWRSPRAQCCHCPWPLPERCHLAMQPTRRLPWAAKAQSALGAGPPDPQAALLALQRLSQLPALPAGPGCGHCLHAAGETDPADLLPHAGTLHLRRLPVSVPLLLLLRYPARACASSPYLGVKAPKFVRRKYLTFRGQSMQVRQTHAVQ